MGRKIGNYLIGQVIGSGGYSKVYLGTHRKTREAVAIKVMKIKKLEKQYGSLEQVRREIAIQKLMNHPNIISLYDVYETDLKVCIVMEYAEKGELFDYIASKRRLDRREAHKFFQQVIYALDYCANLKISHRDLKPENILLDRYNNVKLSDFGLARTMQKTNYLNSRCGSPHYVAPEVLTSDEYDGEKCIVWSAGVLLYVLLAGRLPFDEDDNTILFQRIINGDFRIPFSFTSAESDIIQRMLTPDPEKRITLLEVMRHPFFRQNLPENYVLPRPSRFSESTMIDTENLDDNLVNDLVYIDLGYYDEDEKERILEQLRAKTPNLIKVYYYLYLRRQANGVDLVGRKKGKDISDLDNVYSLEERSLGMVRSKTARNGVRRSSFLVKTNSTEDIDGSFPKSLKKKKGESMCNSQSLREIVGQFRTQSENSTTPADNISPSISHSNTENAKKRRWWFHRLTSKNTPNATMKRYRVLNEFIEKQDYQFKVIIDSDSVAFGVTLPLVEVAEKLQMALDFRKLSWEYVNAREFIVSERSRRPVDFSDEDRPSLRMRIEIEPNPGVDVRNEIDRYSSWDPSKSSKSTRAESSGEKGRGEKSKKWNFFRKKKRKGEVMSMLQEKVTGPTEINRIVFHWLGGDSSAFIDEVATIIKILKLD